MRVPWFGALLGIMGQERNFQENNCHSIQQYPARILCPGVWVHELGPCLGGFRFSNRWQECWVEEEGEELCWFAKDTVVKRSVRDPTQAVELCNNTKGTGRKGSVLFQSFFFPAGELNAKR